MVLKPSIPPTSLAMNETLRSLHKNIICLFPVALTSMEVTNLIFPWETEQDICRFLIIFYRILKMRCNADSLLLMYTKRDCHFTISAKQQSLFIDTFYFLSFTSSNAFRKIRSNSFSEHFFRLDSSEYPLFCCLSCS